MIRMRRAPVRLLWWLGVLWTLPNTVLGLLAGVIGMMLGARMRWQAPEHALVFARMRWPGSGALTLGNVILHTGDGLDVSCFTYAHRAGFATEPRVSLAAHERAHVYQAMVLGPLFLPVYFLCGGISARNRLERAADRYARDGHGWWPFGPAHGSPRMEERRTLAVPEDGSDDRTARP